MDCKTGAAGEDSYHPSRKGNCPELRSQSERSCTVARQKQKLRVLDVRLWRGHGFVEL